MRKLVAMVVTGSRRYLDHWLGIQSLQSAPSRLSRRL